MPDSHTSVFSFELPIYFFFLGSIVTVVLFVFALSNASRKASAHRGGLLGMAGMAFALTAAVWLSVSLSANDVQTFALIAIATASGAAIGIRKAGKSGTTGVPELIALFHSLVALATILAGYGSFASARGAFYRGEIGVAVFLGAITLAGSVVVYLRLSGRIAGAPLAVAKRDWANLTAGVACVLLVAWLAYNRSFGLGFVPLILLTVIASALGAHLVLAIGGRDMPVVTPLLNSYSGWAVALIGFTNRSDLLVATGAFLGSAGAYLSYTMCKTANRSFVSVVLGGFRSERIEVGRNAPGECKETTVAELAQLLADARSVIVVPGYGMALSQAQFPLAELARKLGQIGVSVRFGIHPMAGRIPGHMNVLLAEAKVPYEIIEGMDELDGFASADVALVVGANDIVNPTGEPNSPLAGMPVLRVWEAREVVVVKRSADGAGYAGLVNPLFYEDNAKMLFGDARRTIEEVLAEL